jgi:hypothetical protein
MIKEPFLLSFSICWILLFLVPKPMYWRNTRKRVEWPTRLVLACIGFTTLLFWFALPSA